MLTQRNNFYQLNQNEIAATLNAMAIKTVFAICGSTRVQSANLSILQHIARLAPVEIEFEIYKDLAALPHFNPDHDKETAPTIIEELRNKIKNADGIIICTPEYVFSLPGALKNAIEWCVSTTIFSEKPVALITASASGVKAHESLQLVMKTIYADVREETQLLVQGAKGKMNADGIITDETLLEQIKDLAGAFFQQLQGGD